MMKGSAVAFFLVVLLVMSCCGVTSSIHDVVCQAARGKPGLCNHQMLKLPRPEKAQSNLLFYYGGYFFDNGTSIGCHHGNADLIFGPKIYIHFDCDGDSDTCKSCYWTAVRVLEESCPGRAGGNVMLMTCCLRYELYDICTPHRHHH